MTRERLPTPNPISYVEIPVTDVDRAIAFYEEVFDLALERQVVDGYEMALFADSPDAPGASGALAKGDVYVPGKAGALPYFAVASIEETLSRAAASGGSILYPKKTVGEAGSIAEIEDSEGNRIGLFEAST